MRRSAILFAAVLAAFSFLFNPAAFAAKPDLPTINGIPAMFGTVASGTGTATEYVSYRPVEVDASGAIKVSGSFSVSTTASTAVTVASCTTTVPISIAASVPVTIASCTTSVTTAEIPLVSYLVNTIAISSTPSSLSSPMAERKFCAIVNLGTETVWVNAGSVGVATISEGIPVVQNTYWSDTVGAGVSVHFVCSNTQNISIVQGK